MGRDRPTWKSLINNDFPAHERISLITMIFSSSNQVRMVRSLSGNDAQAFVDEIDNVGSWRLASGEPTKFDLNPHFVD